MRLRHPLLLAAPRAVGGALRFATPAGEVVIGGEDLAPLRAALDRCDGAHDLETVLAATDPPKRADVARALEQLAAAGIVADRARTAFALHRHSTLPPTTADAQDPTPRWTPTDAPAAPLQAARDTSSGALLRRRRSAPPEAFGRPLDRARLAAILRAGYGATGPGLRTVASAGALAPLLVHVVGLDDDAASAPGVWWFDPDEDALRPVASEAAAVRSAFAGALPGEPTMLVTISADLERTASVYGSRGYRYVLIEAGGVLQNLAVAAVQAEVPLRALGRFDDAAAARALQFPDEVVVLLGVALG
jgi:SagB-type dehydrogenase family enzyme